MNNKIPRAAAPVFQHALDTYESETRKTVAVWRAFEGVDPAWTPDVKSSAIAAIWKHQLLSERRFFAEFLGLPDEPLAAAVLPPALTAETCAVRLLELAMPRLAFLAVQNEAWWLGRVGFFDVERERIWIFWRRVLHTAHHRTQLTTYLRMLGRPVPSTYGPTADVTWSGADPTTTAEAAGRK